MAVEILNALNQNDLEISIEGFGYPCTKFSGVEQEYETVEYPVGTSGGKKISRPSGGGKISNITLTKPMQPEDLFLKQWADDPCKPPKTVTVTWQDKCPDKTVITIICYGCRVVRFKSAEGDLDANSIAETELELTVDSYEWK